MSKTLFILNDPPYGTERSFNGLRLAGSLAKGGEEIRVFLLGDAASCANRGQKVPNGYYNIERLLGAVTRHGGKVGVCGLCMDARGLTEEMLCEGCARGSLEQLAEWTLWSERTLVF